MHKGDYHAERIARLLELAGAAQDAADHAANMELRETYLRLAGQWAELAAQAERTSAAAGSPDIATPRRPPDRELN